MELERDFEHCSIFLLIFWVNVDVLRLWISMFHNIFGSCYIVIQIVFDCWRSVSCQTAGAVFHDVKSHVWTDVGVCTNSLSLYIYAYTIHRHSCNPLSLVFFYHLGAVSVSFRSSELVCRGPLRRICQCHPQGPHRPRPPLKSPPSRPAPESYIARCGRP